ncbi:hypothetical protein GCM10023187_28480 [Nibrella viscosa]|uniref:NodB homology domain-containing protein n=2 Tax=Nibrella viscosa TaxID=1084524 RepID=A0ABP8KI44_9BACT
MAALLLLAGLYYYVSVKQRAVRVPTAGVALSFDDRFIEDWYQLRPLFRQYNAKATFYISQFDSLSDNDRRLLDELAQDGHEIGCHGAIHTNAVDFIKGRGQEDYLNSEIRPALAAMRRAGYTPSSFAYPGGARNRETDKLLSTYFSSLRDVTKIERTLAGISLRRPAGWMFEAYSTFASDGLFFALSIDNGDGLTHKNIDASLDKAANDQSVLVLFGHQPFFQQQPPGSYGFDVARLRYILQEASRRHLRFYTMSELVRPG